MKKRAKLQKAKESERETAGKRVNMRIVFNSAEAIFHSAVILYMISAKSPPIQVSFHSLLQNQQ